MKKLLVILSFLLFARPAQAAFTYRVVYTIDNAQVPSTQTNFPVPIALNNANFKTVANGGHVQNSSGFDIVPFTDAGLTTQITGCELEAYSGTAGTGVLWVNVASLSSSAPTLIHVGYGNSAISTNQCTTTSTWDANYKAVHHFPNGATLSVTDSTSNGANGTTAGSPTATSGQLDGAIHLVSASSQYEWFQFINPAAMTIEAWVRATSFPDTYNAVISRSETGAANFQLLVKSNGKLAAYLLASGSVNYDGTGTNTLSTGTWYHLAMAYDSSGGLRVYVNGSLDNSAAANGTINTTAQLTSVGYDWYAAARYWNGDIDEVRISDVARSANYILTDKNSLTFGTLGSELLVGGMKPGTLVTLGAGR